MATRPSATTRTKSKPISPTNPAQPAPAAVTQPAQSVFAQRIESHILILRGVKVIIDADLAELYGVETRTLNQAVKRNPERFPTDFMFQLNPAELEDWRSQVVMSNLGAKMGIRRAPFAFTEHGALMASTVLNSTRAVEMSLYVVRVFAQLREALATHKELAAKLATLESQMQSLALKHDSLTLKHDSQAQNTRAQLKQVFEALRELMTPPEPPAVPTYPQKRGMGFLSDDEPNIVQGDSHNNSRSNKAKKNKK